MNRGFTPLRSVERSARTVFAQILTMNAKVFNIITAVHNIPQTTVHTPRRQPLCLTPLQPQCPTPLQPPMPPRARPLPLQLPMPPQRLTPRLPPPLTAPWSSSSIGRPAAANLRSTPANTARTPASLISIVRQANGAGVSNPTTADPSPSVSTPTPHWEHGPVVDREKPI